MTPPFERRRLLVTAAACACLCAAGGLLLPAPAGAQCDKPGLLLVLDKSSSMVTGTVPSGETKWQAARTAITTITGRFTTSIDFGLVVFPNPSECAAGSVVVQIGPDRTAAINSYLATPPPDSGNWTPMSQTLRGIATYPPLSDVALRRAVVLVTDGWQWCSPYDPATRFDPVSAAAVLRATGATLYVVGFGAGVDSLTLNRIAYQSGTYIPGCNRDQTDPAAADNCYYKAGDLASLTASLDAIARHVTEEVCDALDNDCDAATDEDLERACATICGTGLERCAAGSWAGCTAPRPAAEACDGARDEDCDTVVDEGCECVESETRPCGLDIGECTAGTQSCAAGAWGDCAGATGPAEEECDALDNDCDATVDEGCLCATGDVRACGTDAGACSAGTQTCIGGAWGGCAGSVDPAPEECEGTDDDCDTVVDEGCLCEEGATRPCGTEAGECAAGNQVCAAGAWSGCQGAVWPRGEVCDGLDNDCNGVADNDAVCPDGKTCREGMCAGEDVQVPDEVPPPGDAPAAADKPGCGCGLVR